VTPAKKRERGAAMAETAVVMALLLALLCGVIDMGRAMYTYAFVAQLARQGVRWAVVRGSQCTGVTPCPAQSGSNDIQPYVQGLSNGATDATQLAATLSFPNGCNSQGCIARVTVQYPFRFMVPFVPAGTITIASSSQMVISN
jgi:Flp pilus assembly protein TadG